MTSTNREIIERYYEFLNAQQVDKAIQLTSERGVFHGVDYVGIGINLDTTSKSQVVIKQMFDGGPSVGHLKPGDIITRVKADDHIFEGFEDLSGQSWGPGKLGRQIEVTFQRDGETHVISLTRGRIPAQEFPIQEGLKDMGNYVENIEAKILMTVVEGDKVAVYDTGSFHDKTYNVTVLSTSCSIYRIENEKIVDIWSLDDNSSQLKQLGFKIIPPVKEKA